MGDAQAMNCLGNYYYDGRYGLPQGMNKALELWHQSAELGDAESYCKIGYAYFYGHGVERDEKKSNHYYELAAMGGEATARHNLGNTEIREGNYDRALKHFMIAIEGGYNDSLKQVKQLYMRGHATKDYYMNALQSYQAYLSEIKSGQRDNAAAFGDQYKYY